MYFSGFCHPEFISGSSDSGFCHPEFISESSDNLEQDWKMLK